MSKCPLCGDPHAYLGAGLRRPECVRPSCANFSQKWRDEVFPPVHTVPERETQPMPFDIKEAEGAAAKPTGASLPPLPVIWGGIQFRCALHDQPVPCIECGVRW